MARKNLLAGLLEPDAPLPSPELTAVNPATRPGPGAPATPVVPGAEPPSPLALVTTFAGRGAVGAMSRSLERLTAEMDAARSAEHRLAAGTTAVDLDPGLVDPSPVPDRLPPTSDEADAAFVAAIRDRGQDTPILVRPHPIEPGRYQAAFGHRRLRAAKALGRPVRAFVRALTDEDLVVAQGQENNARADLSFIERANFAAALEAQGYGREVIMAALVVDKTELSRLISVRRAVPDFVVSAVGAAPKAGRGRWSTLAGRLARADAQVLAQRVVMGTAFAHASSDERFARLFEALTPSGPTHRTGAEWTARDGTRVARIDRTRTEVKVAIDERAAPAFGDYLMDRLDELYEAYLRSRAG